MLLDCIYWSDCGVIDGGCCSLNLYGGKPSAGTCTGACTSRTPGNVNVVEVTVARVSALTAAKKATVGRDRWGELHRRALLPVKDRAAEVAFLRTLADDLPGCNCRVSWLAYLAAHPPRFNDYFAWSVEAHNAVNDKLRKPRWDVKRAKAFHGPVASPRDTQGLR